MKKYWDVGSDEISLFQNHEVVVGAAWPYQTTTLKAAHFPAEDTIPSQGATGWADTWMLATKAPHPNCAYMWMRYVRPLRCRPNRPYITARRPPTRLLARL